MVVCCVLFISYNEYTNRYSLLTTNENSIYIFDKKSTALNKCDTKGCTVIETKLPTKIEMSFDAAFQQSKLFDTTPPMTKSINEKIPESAAPVQNSSAKTVEARLVTDPSKMKIDKATSNEKESKSTEKKDDDEFVE